MSLAMCEIAMRAYRQRARAELARDAHAAAARLSIATRSWATVPPAVPALADAALTAEGLRATIAELRATSNTLVERHAA